MTYRLSFRATAEKSWRKLGATIREQLEKKLVERLGNPRVPKDALRPSSAMADILAQCESAGALPLAA